MGSARTDAINQKNEEFKNGRTSFYYVNTQVLERLGITMYKTQAGDNFMRVIPPLDPKVFWAKEVYVHRNIGANGATFVCPKKMYNKPCPICEVVEKMKQANPEDEQIKELVAGKRYLMFVYDVRGEETEAQGLKWYDAPGVVVSNITGLSKDKRTKEIIDVSDPVDGCDIEFVRKGTGLSSKYESFNLKKTDPIPEEWYADVPEFDSVLAVFDYDRMKAELDGGASADEGPTEVQEKQSETPKPATRTRGTQNPVSNAAPEEEQEIPADAETVTPTEPARTQINPAPVTRTRSAISTAPAGGSVTSKIEEIRRRRAAANQAPGTT